MIRPIVFLALVCFAAPEDASGTERKIAKDVQESLNKLLATLSPAEAQRARALSVELIRRYGAPAP